MLRRILVQLCKFQWLDCLFAKFGQLQIVLSYDELL